MRPLALALSLAALLWTAQAAAQVPYEIPIQGTLYNAETGDPIDGTYAVQFTLYEDAAGTTPVWRNTMSVTFVGGIFTAYLGVGAPIDPLVFASQPQIYLGIAVDGDPEFDLVSLASAPYAAMAAFAAEASLLDGFSVAALLDAAVDASRGVFALQAHRHSWGELDDVPAGFADGTDDMLGEAQVDDYVANNGFLTAASPLGWGNLAGVPAGFDDGTDDVLDEAAVDGYVSNNGFLTAASPLGWGNLTSVPSGFADGTDDVLSEAQVDSYVSNNGYLTAASQVAWGNLSGVPAGFSDGTDNVLSESQVDGYVANNGYASRGGTVELFNCTRYPTSGWLNNMDAVLDAQCPANQVLNGLHSYHSNSTEDRQWSYYCCSMRIQ